MLTLTASRLSMMQKLLACTSELVVLRCDAACMRCVCRSNKWPVAAMRCFALHACSSGSLMAPGGGAAALRAGAGGLASIPLGRGAATSRAISVQLNAPRRLLLLCVGEQEMWPAMRAASPPSSSGAAWALARNVGLQWLQHRAAKARLNRGDGVLSHVGSIPCRKNEGQVCKP